MQTEPRIPPAVRQEAAAWLVELQSPAVSEDTLAKWRAWRGAHPDHERAWQRIEAFEGKLRTLSSPLAHATLAAPGSPRRRQAIRTLAVLLFAGGGAWVAEQHMPWREWTADHRTAVGRRDTITLADGTRIDLNADTAIDIRFTGSERIVRLVSGEIRIATAPDPAAAAGHAVRPFLVRTAQGSIRAIGTLFTVRQLDGRPEGESHVAVLEGAVEIRLGDARTRMLAAGQQLRFTRAHIAPSSPAGEGSDAWVEGMIVAQDMPLGDFLAELGRHRPGRLACDPAVAALKVTGTYPLADTDKVLDMLRTTLPVEIHTLTRYWVTVRPHRGKA